MTRREALAGFAQFLAASPLLADRKYSELSDPMYSVANAFDMAKLAKKKLDPLAWDYIDEGSEDEISLRDNRAGFERLLIRPHFLQNDVSKIDISTKLFGKELAHPIFICPTGGKNCVFPNGEQETAYGAGLSNTLMITSGGIDKALDSGKGPKLWWQFTTAAEFRTANQMANFAESCRIRAAAAFPLRLISITCRTASAAFTTGWCGTGAVRAAFPATPKANRRISRMRLCGRPAIFRRPAHFPRPRGIRSSGCARRPPICL
jgi:hypothetical protein